MGVKRIRPSPSLSNKLNASLNSAIWSSVSLSAMPPARLLDRSQNRDGEEDEEASGAKKGGEDEGERTRKWRSGRTRAFSAVDFAASGFAS